MLCLGIESSCDETALALVEDGRLVDAVLASQIDVHALFGGVVPEIAGREHYRFIGSLFDRLLSRSGRTLEEIDYIAVSRGPGLLGSLLVGVAFAKSLALASGARLIAVNHLHAHLLASGLEKKLTFPALGLLVSGGHTHIYRIESPAHFELLGKTLDDAAGEAFDKVAKMFGFPYPGGKIIDILSGRGNADPSMFPRPYLDNSNLDFSFSGLKTSVAQYLSSHPDLLEDSVCMPFNIEKASSRLCDICASFNLAVADTLCAKTERALHYQPDLRHIILAGGVAANSLLRERITKLAAQHGIELSIPSLSLCTDNAAMVAYAGYCLAELGWESQRNFEAVPRGKKIPNDLLLSPFVAGE